MEVQPVFELDSSDAHGLGLRLFEVDDLQRFDASVADVVLSVASVAPRSADHEVGLVGQAHQALEQRLELIPLRGAEQVLESGFVVGLGKVHLVNVVSSCLPTPMAI